MLKKFLNEQSTSTYTFKCAGTIQKVIDIESRQPVEMIEKLPEECHEESDNLSHLINFVKLYLKLKTNSYGSAAKYDLQIEDGIINAFNVSFLDQNKKEVLDPNAATYRLENKIFIKVSKNIADESEIEQAVKNSEGSGKIN